MASKTGPGKSYRKGLSLIEAFRKFPDDATAEAWLADCRWGDEPACPHCGDTNVQTGAKHPTMPYRCRGCRKRFSVRIGTAMQDSNIPLQKWAIAIYLMTTSLKGVSSMKLHRDLGIAQSSAWHMAHRLREAWARQGGLFAGPVEVDEAFFGGLEGNKHKSKKLNVGGGTGGKVPVIGAKDRDSNKVAARVIENTDKATVTEFVEKHADPDAKVYTDGASTYKGRKQEKVKHSVGEFVRGAGAHQRDGIVLGDAQARLHGRLPSHVGEASSAVRERVRGASQHPPDGHARSDARHRPGAGGTAAPQGRSGGLNGTPTQHPVLRGLPRLDAPLG